MSEQRPENPNSLAKQESKRERIKRDGRLINFYSLTAEQEIHLRELIRKAGGKIIVFIHPYYPEEQSLSTDVGWADPKILERMRTGLAKLLLSQREKSPPIFIFEESGKIQQLDQILEGLFARDSYAIPTMHDNPTPLYGGWDQVNRRFESIGVKNIVISGMNLVVSWPDEMDPKLEGCIATAAEGLARKFKLRISKFIYPNSPEDYHRFGGPVGPDHE